MSHPRQATEVEPTEDVISEETPEGPDSDGIDPGTPETRETPEEPDVEASTEGEAGEDSEGGESDDGDSEGGDSEADDPEAGGELAEAAPSRLGPGQHRSDEELERELSALLFMAAEPLGLAKLVTLLERPKPARVRDALEALRGRLAASGLPYELRAIAGGYQLFTTPDVAEVVARTGKVRKEERVSPAAMETLSVIAYRQPVAKAEIEAIRGVQAGPILRTLVDRGLVKVTGRAEVPGSPLLYGTTKRFLDTFGLMGLDELPRDGELVRD